ncbi:MAG: L-seryl-tRNA(Sec) selenium transferase [Rhodomicrobium sp.]
MSNRAGVGSKRDVRAVGRAQLPSVDKVLRSETGLVMAARFGHSTAVHAIRRVLVQVRENSQDEAAYPDAAAVAAAALRLAEGEDALGARRVFNLTGTVLHTNLGRAILPEAAIQAAVEAMRHPIALEFDLATGSRGERDSLVRDLICELTGAEDACIVNNNAGAVLLTLNTLAQGKDAIVSRGELIEIGGSFRLPDIMVRAGAHLAEVGTTNRTHLKDYEQAAGDNAGLILKAHTSNYVIQGFTKSVPAEELAALAHSRGIPFVHDLGSGALADLGRYGLKSEPTVGQALAEGADIVTFSGDKLLGGPQAGIVAGRKDLIAKIAQNPMKRALRLDKIRLAALEAVLKLYRDPDRLPETLPTLRAFVRPQSDITASASRLRDAIAAAAGEAYSVRIAECMSQVGSGSLPLETLPSAGIAIAPVERKGAGRRLDALASAFRGLPIPVIGRIADGELILDLRCLDDEAAFLGQIHRLRFDASAGVPREAGS